MQGDVFSLNRRCEVFETVEFVMSVEEEEEYDKLGDEFGIQAPTKIGFPSCEVSGWDDDVQGVEEERNPFGMLLVLC